MAAWETLLWKPLYEAKAITDYHSKHPMDLSFDAGTTIQVMGEENKDWLNGATSGKFGSFPACHVQKVDTVEAEVPKPAPRPRQSVDEANTPKNGPALPPRPTTAVVPERPAPPQIPARPTSKGPNPPSRPVPPKAGMAVAASPSPPPANGGYNHRNGASTPDALDVLRSLEPVVDGAFQGEHYRPDLYDMDELDEYARQCPNTETSSIQSLAHYLASPFEEHIYKLRSIFVWIATNISYDINAFLSGNVRPTTPENTLRTRSGVCEGYAGLFNALAEAAGVPCWKVTGDAKGFGSQPGKHNYGPHAWNVVCINGEYLFIDSTWGAGYCCGTQFIRKFQPFYFLCSPKRLIYSHWPTNPQYQYMTPLLDQQYFEILPYSSTPYWDHDMEIIGPRPRSSSLATNNNIIDIYINVNHWGTLSHFTGFIETIGSSQKVPVMIQRCDSDEYDNLIWIHAVCQSSGDFLIKTFVADAGKAEGQGFCTWHVYNSGPGQAVTLPSTLLSNFEFSIMSPLGLDRSNSTANVPVRILMWKTSKQLPQKLVLMSDPSNRIDIPQKKVTTKYVEYSSMVTFKRGKYTLFCQVGTAASMPGIASFEV